MTRYQLSILFFLLTTMTLLSQEAPLEAFQNLVNKTWSANGNWSNGSKFSQEIYFYYGLNKTIIVSDSKGFIDNDQTTFGERSHGVKQFNTSKGVIEFWEFDVFGTITKGKVTTNDKSIWYTYKYGETILTDLWEYVDAETYNFIVGVYENNSWKIKYLQTQFKLKERQ